MAFYDGETTKNYLYVRFLVLYEIFSLVGRVSRIADISSTVECGLNEVLVTSVIIFIADMTYVPFPIAREIFNCRFRHGKLHQFNRREYYGFSAQKHPEYTTVKRMTTGIDMSSISEILSISIMRF